MLGCWMIGAEVVNWDWGISENLNKDLKKKISKKGRTYILFTEEIPESSNCIFRVFDELLHGLISNILLKFNQQPLVQENGRFFTISSPWNATAQAICRSPSSLAIHSANPSYKIKNIHRFKTKHFFFFSFTFVKTAIEANELPKLMPTTNGSFEAGMDASAMPFGTAVVVITPRG